MDSEQIMEDYKKFVANFYMKIRNQCHSYGELKAQIKSARKNLRWEHGDDFGKMMELILQKEIDSVLETLPISDAK